MKRFLNWLGTKLSPPKATPKPDLTQTGTQLRQSGIQRRRPARRAKQAVPDRQPEFVDPNSRLEGRIENRGPGKNVLMKSKFVREDTGTHETLKILDESYIDTQESEGIDPYNTGRFDRARNWEKRRK